MLFIKILALVITTFLSIFTLIKEIQRSKHWRRRVLPCFFIFLSLLAGIFLLITIIRDYIEIQELKKTAYVVKTIDVVVTIEFPTMSENAYLETMRIGLGNYNVAGLKSSDGSVYLLNSNEMVSTITTLKKSIKYCFVYEPPYDSKLPGCRIKELKRIRYFICNYTNELRDYSGRVDERCSVQFTIQVKINGITVGEKSATRYFQRLMKGDIQLDISSIFDEIEKKSP